MQLLEKGFESEVGREGLGCKCRAWNNVLMFLMEMDQKVEGKVTLQPCEPAAQGHQNVIGELWRAEEFKAGVKGFTGQQHW